MEAVLQQIFGQSSVAHCLCQVAADTQLAADEQLFDHPLEDFVFRSSARLDIADRRRSIQRTFRSGAVHKGKVPVK